MKKYLRCLTAVALFAALPLFAGAKIKRGYR